MMRKGLSMGLCQASQQASGISSYVSKARLASQVWLRNRQTSSTGTSSGEDDQSVSARFDGLRDFLDVQCHRLGFASGQPRRGAGTALRTDRSEQMSALVGRMTIIGSRLERECAMIQSSIPHKIGRV